MSPAKLPTLFLLALAFVAPSLPASSIGGALFEDLDRDGVRDVDEAALQDVQVLLIGAEGTVLRATRTGVDGSYRFDGLANGDYVVSARPASSLRATLPQVGADPPPIPDFPFGRARYGTHPWMVPALFKSAQLGRDFRHVGLGDSIGFGFNFCGSLLGGDGYFEPTTDRLARATAANVIKDKQAIPGDETSDLLEPGSDLGFANDVFYTVDRRPGVVSISIGGNDFLNNDGNDASIAAALVVARKNLQETASSLVRQLPFATVELNTVYDNLEGADAQHNLWVPIWDQVLREVTWGQAKRVTVAEIWPEYAHDEDGQVLGEPGLICNDFLGLDGIHPTKRGYDVHEEKLWQSFGGVTLAGSDRLDVDLGYLPRARRQDATEFTVVGGQVTSPELALGEDGVGALVGSDGAELRLAGFQPDPVPGTQIAQAVLHVRFRTTAAPIDDRYRIEASVDGSYAAPGDTATTWNTILPLLGSAGNSGAEVVAFPDQPRFVEVAAPVYGGAPVDASPTLTWDDLATLSVRVTTEAVGTADPYQFEWDTAWLEIYELPAGAAPAGRLDDPDPARRRAAALEAAVRDRRAAREAVVARLAERPDVALAAVLPEVCDRRDAALVTRLVRDATPLVRGHAVRALACLDAGDRSALLSVASMDPDPGVRRSVARGLAKLGDARPAGILERLASDADAGVRRLATLALGDLPGTEETLAAVLRWDDAPDVRGAAAAGLLAAGRLDGIDLLIDEATAARPSRVAQEALLASPIALEPLLARLGDSQPRVRARAVELVGLSAHPVPDGLAALRRLLDDAEPQVRWAAAAALSRRGDAASLGRILALSTDGASETDRVLVLARYAQPEARSALADLALGAADPSARRLAARALAASADPRAVRWLRRLGGAADESVRRLAQSGLALASAGER